MSPGAYYDKLALEDIMPVITLIMYILKYWEKINEKNITQNMLRQFCIIIVAKIKNLLTTGKLTVQFYTHITPHIYILNTHTHISYRFYPV